MEIPEGEERMDGGAIQRDDRWQTPRRPGGGGARRAQMSLGQRRHSVWHYNEGYVSSWSESESPLPCPTRRSPMVYTVRGILQAGTLEWAASLFSRGSSQPRDRTQVSRIAGGFFTSWAIREAQEYWSGQPIPSPADFPRNHTGDLCIAGRFFSIKHYETFTTIK